MHDGDSAAAVPATAGTAGDSGLQALQRWVEQRDEQAFAAIVTTYERLVRFACRRVLGSGEDCEDAAQETFIRLAQNAAQVRSNLSAWLYACARSTAINMLNSQTSRRRREFASAADAAQMQADRLDPGDVENLEAVERQLAELGPGDREVLVSYFLQGQTQEQIGSRLGISQVAAKKRIDRATDRLRRRLGARAASAAALLLLLGQEAAASTGPSLAPALLARGLPPVKSAWLPATVLVAATVLAALVVGTVGWWLWGGEGSAPVEVSVPTAYPVESVAVPVAPPEPVAPPPAWGTAWEAFRATPEARGDLGLALHAPGIAQLAWAHRLRPTGNVVIRARLCVSKGLCPYASVLLGLCDAAGKEGVPDWDALMSTWQPVRLSRPGQWQEVQLEIREKGESAQVTWFLAGKRRLERNLPVDATRHVLLLTGSAWAELTDLRYEPLP